MTHVKSSILASLHSVMEKCGYVQKKGKNTFHGYKYAGEADLLEVLRPAMIEAGLMLIPSQEEVQPIDSHGNTLVKVAYTLAHKDGEVWPEKIIAYGCGNDRNKNGVGDKGLYKALTGANKYLLFKLFQIETGDDPEASEGTPVIHRNITEKQEQELVNLINQKGVKSSVFLKYYKIENYDEMPSDKFASAKASLENKADA